MEIEFFNEQIIIILLHLKYGYWKVINFKRELSRAMKASNNEDLGSYT